MFRPAVKIEFLPNKEHYFPGDVVRARVSLISPKPTLLRDVYAHLVGPDYTGSKKLLGDRLDLSGGVQKTYDVDFVIPLYPKPEIRFDIQQKNGEVVHIEFGPPWRIEVRDRGNELLAVANFFLVVPPPNIFSDMIECKAVPPIPQYAPGKNPYIALVKFDGLRLMLPRLEWVEGEIIEGKLSVKAQKDGAIKGLKIRLVRNAKQYVANSWSKFLQSEAIDSEIVLFDAERRFSAGEETEYTFALPIQKRGWPTRYTKNDYVESKIVVDIGGGFWNTKSANFLVYIYNGNGPRFVESISADVTEALLADARIIQFYKNTVREWYSGLLPVFAAMSPGTYNLACAVPVAMSGDEFLRNYPPSQMPLAKFFTLVKPESDEYLVYHSFTAERGGFVLTNYRLLLFSSAQSAREIHINDIVSIETKAVPPKCSVKLKSGEVVVEKIPLGIDLTNLIQALHR